MSIKSQIKTTIGFVILLSIIFSFTISQSLQTYQRALDKTEISGSIVLQAFETKVLADEYVTDKTERAKTQWFSKQEDIKKILAANQVKFDTDQEKDLVVRMNKGIGDSEVAFRKLINLSENPTASSQGVLVEQENALTSQLSVAAQETISSASNLSDINNRNLTASFQQIILLFSVIATLFFCMLIISFWVIVRATNVSEKRRAQNEAILASVGDGLVSIDEAGKVTNINQSGVTLLGYTHDELKGKKFTEILQMVDGKGNQIVAEQRPFAIALSTGKIVTSNSTNSYSYIKKDGTRFPASVTVSPVISKSKIIGAVEVFRDITKEKEVDRMKTEFISLASHQLRTPLSAMKWFLEMLLSGDAGKLTKEQREYVQNVDQSNERMIQLVNSLLNVSRIESGRIIVDPVPTDLSQLVKDVKTDLQGKLAEKKQKLVISINEKLEKINLDPKLIRQVYMNLLTNAIKYSPQNGEITILISKKDDMVISQVSDKGYGIPEKDKAKVFQKFYRGDNIIKKETDGNGLGLYLVKSIIESSHGQIWYESQEGKGTSFFFTIPVSGMVPKKGEVTIDG